MDIGGKKMKIDLGILQIQEQLDSSIQTRMLKNFAFMIVATVLFLEIVIISVINRIKVRFLKNKRRGENE